MNKHHHPQGSSSRPEGAASPDHVLNQYEQTAEIFNEPF
jgi:hypothetical protein